MDASKTRATLRIENASQVVTCAGFSASPARGADLGKLGVIEDGAVAIAGDRILDVGPAERIRRDHPLPAHRIVDAEGGVVLPGFVDSHTHLVFGGDRADEWEARMQGKPYLDILREGGGIHRTVKATREAGFDELVRSGRMWAERCIEHGTTTLEIKSGYRLDPEGELELLRVIRAFGRHLPAHVFPTFLAHTVPLAMQGEREAYLDGLLDALRTAARSNLIEQVDVFCEAGAFTLDEAERILLCGQEESVGLKIHAEQFTSSGAALLGARLGAISVDHLEHLTESDARQMASMERPPVGVLLPAVPFHLGMSEQPPARMLIESGLPIALATDMNPGSSFTPSMPMVIALACRSLRMTVAEAIMASTINAAHALDVGGCFGSLEPGKWADLLICDIPDHRWLGYAFGWNPVRDVFIDGRRVRGRRLPPPAP